MTCSLEQFRARVGAFYARALKLTRKLSFISADNIASFLLLANYGHMGITCGLFLFILLNNTQPNITKLIQLDNKLGLYRERIPHKHAQSACIKTSHLLTMMIILLILLGGDIHPNPGPVDFISNGLSIIHLNARSLNNKIPLVQCEASCFDIITVTETWFSDKIDNNSVSIPGFLPPLRRDRPGDPHGGVAVYVKKNLVCKPRPDLSVPDLEALWVETKLNQDTLLIGTIYRPPGSNVAYWDLVDQSIQRAGSTPHRYIVFGDFNADCSNHPPQHLQNIMNTNSLFQLVNIPTRVTEDTSSILDLILTPCPDMIQHKDVLPPICSDHSCPYVILKQQRTACGHYKRTLFNYTKLNKPKLIDEISKLDWDAIVSLDPIDSAADKFSDTLLSVAKLCMPVKEVTINERDAPWITEDIKKKIKKKNLIHRLAKILNFEWTWALFRTTRNNLTDAIRHRKMEYISELDNRISSAGNFGSKDWWKLVRSFISNKGMPQDDIPPLEKNNTVYYSPKDKATIFNEYFASQCSVTDEGNDLPILDNFPVSIEELVLTTDTVLETLKRLDGSKAVGPDLIHNKLLIVDADAICQPLTRLFNGSLSEGKFPAT